MWKELSLDTKKGQIHWTCESISKWWPCTCKGEDEFERKTKKKRALSKREKIKIRKQTEESLCRELPMKKKENSFDFLWNKRSPLSIRLGLIQRTQVRFVILHWRYDTTLRFLTSHICWCSKSDRWITPIGELLNSSLCPTPANEG